MRTDEVIGVIYELPTTGIPFVMWAEPLDTSKTIREIQTSIVKKVEIDNEVWTLTTENSVYTLEKLKNLE